MPDKINNDERFMRRAMSLARKGMGVTSPNPMVGAVIVSDGQIIAEGWHKAAGRMHAEAEALAKVGGSAVGATMYVNLEPCIHFGKTAPCAPAIVKAGIRRVVIGCIDPNPKVSGKGIAYLKDHGVETVTGVLQDEAMDLNRAFFKHITTGTPWVTLKMAMTVDGRIADRWMDSKYISNKESLQWVHKQRTISDAVMVGIGTIISDNPLLTPRNVKIVKYPVRVVPDNNLQIHNDNILIKTAHDSPVWIYHGRSNPDKEHELEEVGCKIIKVESRNGLLDLKSVLKDMGRRGIQTVMVEGGARLAASLVREGLWDELAIFVAPKIAGDDRAISIFTGLEEGVSIGSFKEMKLHKVSRFGDDVLLIYRRK